MRWGVVVLAGGLVKDPLASALGTPRKALAQFRGRSSLWWTLDAVKGAGFTDCVTISGDDVATEVHHGRLVMEKDTQIENARTGVEALVDADAVLFLPCDCPLLAPEHLHRFTQEVEARVKEGAEKWLSIGLCSLEKFKEKFPRLATTPILLRDGSYLSGSLYAGSVPAFMDATGLLERLSQSRKSQLDLLWKLGPWVLVRYLMHRVTLQEARERLERVFDCDGVIVTGCEPEM
ncbi:MAG TPA: nucleotidyltransferase family protein, partial [Fimbriimonadaceae bacterium]|nr:nucleotidyltransferase family protein [Fimbriimonadaceae bacterium]